MTKSAISRKRKRSKVVHREDAGYIVQLRRDRFQIHPKKLGWRHRPSRPTLDAAKAELQRIAAAKSQGVKPSAATATFNDALDLVEPRNTRKGLRLNSRRRSRHNTKLLRREFGTRKLNEFVTERMKFVQDWLDSSKYAKGSQDHFKSHH